MPQLDKYIFFNHVISLTIFFFLIYIFIRGSVVPEISTLLKYRKKKLDFFSSELKEYEKIFNFGKIKFKNKGNGVLISLLKVLNNLINFYNNKWNKQYKIVNFDFFLFLKKNHKLLFNLFYKNTKEINRLVTVR